VARRYTVRAVSSGPPAYPPPPPSGGMQPPPPPQRTRPSGILSQFQGMQWWEILLVLLPLTLIFVGGIIGGVCGALGAIGNTYIARSSLSPAARVALMIGVLAAAYVLYFIVAVLIFAAIHSTSS